VIFLFTDFTRDGPYVGQMQAVLATKAPGMTVIDLMHDAPAHAPKPAAYLLAALAAAFPEDAVCVGVVDPGVGTERPPVVVEADGRRFVGPGNGLFELVGRRATTTRTRRIQWRPDTLSASFHGRDLFAPVAAMLAADSAPGDLFAPQPAEAMPGAEWPDDLPEIIYADGFGNLMTGLRAETVPASATLRAGGAVLSPARVFGEAPADTPFWYVNSCGLVEIALPSGSAAALLGLTVGDPIEIG
jgi:S-adenosyl-L-methionine hydrolase (adenosine-forming)